MLLSTAAFTANVLLIRALGQVQSVNVWLIYCTRFVVGLDERLAAHEVIGTVRSATPANAEAE